MTSPLDPSYREIPLTKGQVAIVDADMFDELNKHNWCATFDPTEGRYYAIRMTSRKTGKRHRIWMHRQIMGLEHGDLRQVDHIETTLTLFNVRSNLRVATHQQNQCNKPKYRCNKSGYKGVRFTKGKWEANITVHEKMIYLGRRDTAEEAYALYCEAAVRLHGEFARVA